MDLLDGRRYACGMIELLEARKQGSDLLLRLSSGDVLCIAPMAINLRFEGFDKPELLTEHPLLWPHRDSRTQLFFRGVPKDAHALLGRLWESHFHFCGGLLRLEDFLAHPFELRRKLAEGFGLLAEGPEILLREYAKVLAAEGLEASFQGARPPLRFDGRNWVAEDLPLSLLLLGTSWVIAPAFEGL